MKKSNILKYLLILAAVIIVIVVAVVLLSDGGGKNEINYRGKTVVDGVEQYGLLDKIERGEVKAVYVSGGYMVYVIYNNAETNLEARQLPGKYHAFCRILSRAQFMDDLGKILEANAEAHAADPSVTKIESPVIIGDDPNKGSTITSIIVPIIALVVMGILVFYIMRQATGSNSKAMNFGKTKARLNINVKERFTDVAGAEEEKAELAEIVEFLKNPKKFSSVGARIPKGVLLVGPPGTGKTLFAKAVAGEANVPFFSISGSDFVEMFVGTGAARVRDLFDQAKHNMPCIVFIDEIDAVGRQRGAGMGGGNDEREQTLNQLLVQMDGFETNDGIIIMAATNRADILDPALMRPGRFDRQIYVSAPDVKGREEILKVHARNKPIAGDVSFKVLARMTSGFTGADLENLLNEAAILAARANRTSIVMEDILEGINKVIAGPQKRSRVVTDRDKRITAYHEAGHAIIMKLLPNCDEVQEVSIIPRGMAAGYTLSRPESDDNHVTKNKLLDMITGLLGGRAAEAIVIKDISVGASNDIERANGIARKMVTEWGMSERLGNIFLGGQQEVFLGRDYATHANYSEAVSGVVDEEIGKIIKECYDRAFKILQENRKVMDNMVKVLFEKETIYTVEVDMLFDGKSAEEVSKYIDKRSSAKDAYKRVNIVPEPAPLSSDAPASFDSDPFAPKAGSRTAEEILGEPQDKDDKQE